MTTEGTLLTGSESQATAVAERHLCFQDYMQGLTRIRRQKEKEKKCCEPNITALEKYMVENKW